jgi:flavodoxin
MFRDKLTLFFPADTGLYSSAAPSGMSVCIIYHSETGTTRAVAELVAALIGTDLIEVKDLAGYSKLSMYLKGAPRAMQGKKADIEPAVIDVSGYDAVVVGTPVWAGNPTPAFNAAVAALVGIEGKAAVVFCTSGGAPGKTLDTVKAMLADRGAVVRGAVAFTTRDVQKPEAVEALINLVRPLVKTGQ